MRGVWAELQNRALERAGEIERVDHRSLEAQRETALDKGDTLSADELDRDPELKLGPAANSMERREKAAAEREGRNYVPVTERGAVVHAARQARAAFRDMRERLDVARETYVAEREAGQGRVSAGLAALRAAVDKDRSGERGAEDVRERLGRITDRGRERDDMPEPEAGGGKTARDRLKDILDREASDTPQAAVHKLDGHGELEQGDQGGAPSRASAHRQSRDQSKDIEREERKPSFKERLEEVLSKPRERLEIEEEPKTEREVDREVDLGRSHSL